MEDSPIRSEAGFYCPAYVGLRCLLLLAVLEGHYWFESAHARVGYLTLAVPCFFALSGFLISHTLFSYESLPARTALKIFYIRRMLRILPAYYLVLLLAQLARGVACLPWHLCYLLNFKIFTMSVSFEGFREFMSYRDFNAIHLWSVCVEEQFYLVYPLFVLGTPRKWRTVLLAVAIAVSIGTRLTLRWLYPQAFCGGLPFLAGEYILWGCLFAWMDFRQRWRWLRSPWTLYVSLLSLTLFAYQDTSFDRFAQWKPPTHQTLYCLLIATFVAALRHNNQSYLNRAMSCKPMAWIGTMSYGAYLVHSFLNPVADQLVAAYPALAPFPQCPRALIGPVLTISTAALLWFAYERPIQGLRTRWRSRS